MDYYFNKMLNCTFEEAIKLATCKLKEDGFGVLTEINLHEKFKEKLNVDFKRYIILGACNPAFAYKALLAEEKIGTMLPCNVLVIEQNENEIEIVAVNPMASMMAIQNPALADVAMQVTDKLKNFIAKL